MAAGFRNAVPAPTTNAATAQCQTSMAPATESAPSDAVAISCAASLPTITARRSSRSTITPATGRQARSPTDHASSTSESVVAWLSSASTWNAIATR